ncbi:hypothetical protein BH10PLA1_BH10PLA1_18530 [soil metagenome]
MIEPAPLNLFQRLLRQWDHAHPYNASQAVHVRGTIDLSDATNAWHRTLITMGLGRVKVGHGNFHYEALDVPWRDRPVTVVPESTTLDEYLTEQLNTPFEDPEEPPFRPFIRQAEGTYHLGLTYQHWVADSISIRLLLREWFLRLHDSAACQTRVSQPSNGYWMLFGPHNSDWHLLEGGINTLRRYFRYRQVKKVESTGIHDGTVVVRLDQSTNGLIDKVYDYSRANQVKVNDVFVACMAELCQKYVPLQARARRTDLAVGSIVDLRPFSQSNLDDVFSIFLGFNSVVCTPRELGDWGMLLKSIAQQNRAHHNSGMIQGSLLWMMSALMVGRFVRPEKLYHFYRKEVPLAGGVSNVTLKDSWATRYHPDPILSYVRVSPTGPMTPIVFTTTTLGSNLQVGVTYRKALITPDRAGVMTRAFFDRLHSLT